MTIPHFEYVPISFGRILVPDCAFAHHKQIKLLQMVTWGRQSRIEQGLCERRGACEPAVEDEEAGEIPEDERREDCLINYL